MRSCDSALYATPNCVSDCMIVHNADPVIYCCVRRPSVQKVRAAGHEYMTQAQQVTLDAPHVVVAGVLLRTKQGSETAMSLADALQVHCSCATETLPPHGDRMVLFDVCAMQGALSLQMLACQAVTMTSIVRSRHVLPHHAVALERWWRPRPHFRQPVSLWHPSVHVQRVEARS